MKRKVAILVVATSLFLGGCDTGKDDLVAEMKKDLSIEYGVPINDVEVEVVEYGITVFTTKQLKVKIKSKELSFYMVDKSSGHGFTRIPIKEEAK